MSASSAVLRRAPPVGCSGSDGPFISAPSDRASGRDRAVGEPTGAGLPRYSFVTPNPSTTGRTRSDVSELLALAAEIPLAPETQEFPLEAANDALRELKARRIRGAKVLRVERS